MGLFEHMHIKGHTAGSSNELSFDVLQNAMGDSGPLPKVSSIASRKGKGGSINLSKVDAASEAAAQAYAKSKGKGGSQRKGSPLTSGSHGQSYVLSGSSEVIKRKKARLGFSVVTRVIGVLVVILLLCAGIFLNDRISQDRMSFKSRLTNLTMQLANIDRELVIIDQLTVEPLLAADYEQMETLLGEMPGITSSIVGVEDQAAEIRSTQPAGYNSEALSELETAAQARIGLVDNASRLFTLCVQAGTYIQQANTTWDLVVESSKKAAEAAEQANQTATTEAIEKDNATLREAMSELSTALQQLEYLKSNLNSADLAIYVEYATVKRQSLQYALETNMALLDMERESAQEANEKYNKAEQESVELASKISQPISDVVRACYQERVNVLESDYESARNAVIEADYALRQRIA